MFEEDKFENQEQEGHRSLMEMLRGPVRDTNWSRSVAELETADMFL
jgi:hypothetical protein